MNFDQYTQQCNFYGESSAVELVEKYGSPLYVYNEDILKQRCREMMNLIRYPNFKVHYSVKANSNLELLKIIRKEGLFVDAMSPGEMFMELKAGFKPEQILFICNNVSANEMKYAIERNINVSVDSLSQLDLYGNLNPGGDVFVRINPGIGVGHSENVITGGKKTKFGIEMKSIPQLKKILLKHKLNLIGINQHLGSHFMSWFEYINSVNVVLNIAKEFDNLQIIDLGGGFGIPYHKQDNEQRLNLSELGSELNERLLKWSNKHNREIEFRVEPGRYIVAECCTLLGTVFTKKENDYRKYVGTNLGFNVFKRKVMYDSYHDVELYRKNKDINIKEREKVIIVGDICESGDIIASDRYLPKIEEGDIIGVMDAGAYGYSMACNYNNRFRPAEVLIDSKGKDRLIRKRETFEDLLNSFL